MTREKAKMKIEVDLEDDGTNTVVHTSNLIDQIYDYFEQDIYGGEVVKNTVHTGMKNGVIFSGLDTEYSEVYRVVIVKIDKKDKK